MHSPSDLQEDQQHCTTLFIAHFPSAHEDQGVCFTITVLPSYSKGAGVMLSKFD